MPEETTTGIDFTKYGVPLEEDEAKQFDVEQKSSLKKVGEFLVPTTTKTLGKLKKGELPTFREAAGTALEIGSFAIPAGAIFRVLGLTAKFGIRGLQLAKSVQKARQATKGLTTAQKATQIAQKTGQITKRGAIIGAEAGGLLAGGQALGEEDKNIAQVIGETAIGAVTGALGGALITPAISLGALGTKGVFGLISKVIAKTERLRFKGGVGNARKLLSENLEKSFFEAQPAQQKSFDKLVAAYRNRKGPKTTKEFFDELATNGLIPVPEGKATAPFAIANALPPLEEASTRIAKAASMRSKFLESVTKTVKSSQLKKEAKDLLTDRTDADEAAFRQLDRIIDNQLQGKKVLLAKDLNEIAIRLNKQKYTLPSNMITRATGNIIDTMVPVGSKTVRTLNKEMSDLFRMKDTLDLIHRKRINMGFFTSAAGRYAGLYAAGVVGIAGGPANPLFVAALGSQLGLRVITNMLAHQRFNPKVVDVVRKAFEKEGALLKKLMSEASPKDKKILERIMKGGPEKTTTPVKKTIKRKQEFDEGKGTLSELESLGEDID